MLTAAIWAKVQLSVFWHAGQELVLGFGVLGVVEGGLVAALTQHLMSEEPGQRSETKVPPLQPLLATLRQKPEPPDGGLHLISTQH